MTYVKAYPTVTFSGLEATFRHLKATPTVEHRYEHLNSMANLDMNSYSFTISFPSEWVDLRRDLYLIVVATAAMTWDRI